MPIKLSGVAVTAGAKRGDRSGWRQRGVTVAASKSSGLASLGKLTELKQRLLFVIGALIVFRLGSFIPVPGVNPEAMARLVSNSGGLIDMFNMFSGGALSRFSLFALGVIPYISASIVVQMFSSVVPAWQALKKEGESGRRKLTTYTRLGTVGLARSSRSASPRCCRPRPAWSTRRARVSSSVPWSD